MKGMYNVNYFNLFCVIFFILKRNGFYCFIICKYKYGMILGEVRDFYCMIKIIMVLRMC